MIASVSKESLFDIHQRQLSTEQSNAAEMQHLVESLAGIDTILSVFLSPKYNIDLSRTQLNSIHTLIKGTDTDIGATDDHSSKSYTFKKSNTIIEQLSNGSTAAKLLNNQKDLWRSLHSQHFYGSCLSISIMIPLGTGGILPLGD